MPASPPMTLGTQVDDTVITSGVKSALIADDLVKSLDLQVETRKGVVQISGFVDSQAQIDQALALTRAVAGVTDVENGISLKGAPGTVGTAIDDTAVTARVKSALLADPGIKSLDISVLTHKGEVQLTGFVNRSDQIEQAGKLARCRRRGQWREERTHGQEVNAMATHPKLTSVKVLRQQARQHIERGAVTEGYSADRPQVLKNAQRGPGDRDRLRAALPPSPLHGTRHPQPDRGRRIPGAFQRRAGPRRPAGRAHRAARRRARLFTRQPERAQPRRIRRPPRPCPR